MDIPTDIISQLIRDEGEILHAYQDSKGLWTIGVGRLIDLRKGGGITDEESRYLLNNDLTNTNLLLKTHLPWVTELDPVRFAVLQALCFNMGIEHLVGFHRTLTLTEDGDYAGAALEMLKSTWTQQVGARAQRLALQMQTGQWV